MNDLIVNKVSESGLVTLDLADYYPKGETVLFDMKDHLFMGLILKEKEFVGLTVFGRMHQYYPLISKDTYSKATMKGFVKGYFEGSFSNAVSFMVKENNLTVEELELLLKQLKKKS